MSEDSERMKDLLEITNFYNQNFLFLFAGDFYVIQEKVKQQGIYESLIRDMMVGFGKWDFGPLELENPFPENDGNPVQIWQGCEDRIISCQIQRYVAERLPWIKYYEISDGGHLLPHNTTVIDAVQRSLLIAEEPSFI
ncbi:uncharacterized protein LOC113311469 [Papaver somniferum]|uniref:uncharacterized protein LOC113311469 n=1 Tax=Papaver somniferum TaxID=3469 RepID=UPI000E6FC6D3|nr:uncharacterized protein LOC113311469 [Papaver somniferum]